MWRRRRTICPQIWNFYQYFLNSLLLPERNHLCVQSKASQNQNYLFEVDGCRYEAQVLWECRALFLFVCCAPCGAQAQTSWLFSHTPTAVIWSVKVSRLKMRRGDWFFFFLLTGCVLWVHSLMSSSLCTDGPNWSVIQTQKEYGVMLLLYVQYA